MCGRRLADDFLIPEQSVVPLMQNVNALPLAAKVLLTFVTTQLVCAESDELQGEVITIPPSVIV